MINRHPGTGRFVCSFLLFALLVSGRLGWAADGLQTEAERTDYQATSTYSQVVDFCGRLAADSAVVRLGKLGTSLEGRELPLVILANPPIATPQQARESKKLVVLAIANIHAGEVDGKEALLMLARDIATAQERPLLKDLIIVLAPIFNADGNEKFGNRRPTQAGPPQVGTRENAQQFDLNRDFVKLESPEVQALVQTINAWDPAVFIDLHTTNGSYHQYTITYEGGRNPAGDARVVDYVRDAILPSVTRTMEARTGYKSFFYGNFVQDHKGWETISPQPRYGIHYVGLRNRIAILSESYTYAPFKDRVLAGKAFVEEILDHTADNQQAVRQILKAVDSARPEKIALKYDAAPILPPQQVQGFVEERRDGRTAPTTQHKTYEAQYLGGTKVTLAVDRPQAYLIPAGFTAAADTLKRHGIQLEALAADSEMSVEVYKVDAIRRGPTFQKHPLETLAVSSRSETRPIKAGTWVVKTDQPLGTLAATLLEPQSADGLATWNFFDENLSEGADFPVLRLIAAVPARAPAAAQQQATGANPQRGGRGGGGTVSWLEDGEHYVQTSGNRSSKVNALSGESVPVNDTAKMVEGLRALPAIGRQADTLASGGRLRMNAKRTAALVEYDNDLYFIKVDGTGAVRLTNSPTREEESMLSPDGTHVAYLRGNNLYLVDVATQTERQLTSDGSDTIFNGKASWVYYEEVFGRTRRTYWWSPDSRQIAFLKFDDAPVRKFMLQDPTNNRQRNEAAAYPVSGAPNPTVSLGTISVSSREVKFVDLNEYSEANRIITGVGWTPDGAELYCFVQNRQQTWLDLLFYSPADDKSQRMLRQTSRAWVQDPGELKFMPDWGTDGKKQFMISTETTGWKHFELWNRDGKAPLQPAAAGEWEERSLHHAGGPDGWIYFSSGKDYGLGSHLYRMKAGGEQMEKLTQEDGEHRINMSPSGKYYVDTFSNVKTPTQSRLYQADGTLLRTLDGGSPGAGGGRGPGRSRYELHQIKTPDGITLDASILYPPGFDENKKYPVWYMTYAGPRSAQVHDRWGAGSGDEQYARLGFIVFHCDPRSASNKSAASAWTAYQQLGVQEMKDIETAIGWLNEHPFIDSQRIGMSGTSYGGFMTAYAMTHSKLFAAGIAGAPVTDWHNYDSIYTERYMNTPEENPDGYNKTSVVKAAANLHGRLLLVHGLLDDNVHPANTMQLAEALQRANKEFEMMIYPRARHGNFGQHYQKLSVDFMVRNLKPERAGTATSEPAELEPADEPKQPAEREE